MKVEEMGVENLEGKLNSFRITAVKKRQIKKEKLIKIKD